MGKITPLIACLALAAPTFAASNDTPTPDARAALLQSAQQLKQSIDKAIVYVRSWDTQVQSAALAAPASASLLNQVHYHLSGAGSASVLRQLKAAQADAVRGLSGIQKLPSACGVKGEQIETWLSQVDQVVSALKNASAQTLSLQKSISTSELQWDAQIDHLTNPPAGKPPAEAKALAQLRKQPEPLYLAAHGLYQSLSPNAPNSFQNLLSRFANNPLGSCPSEQSSTNLAPTKPHVSAPGAASPSARTMSAALPSVPTGKGPTVPVQKSGATAVLSLGSNEMRRELTTAHPGGRPLGNSTATSQAPLAKAPDINAGLQSVAGTLSSCGQGFGNTLKTRGVQMAGMIVSAPFQLTNTIADLIKGDFSWDKDSAAPAWAQGWLSQNSDPTLLDSVLSGKPLNQPLPYEVCSGIADVAMSLPPGAVLARIPVATSLITKAIVYAPKILPLVSAGEKLGLVPKASRLTALKMLSDNDAQAIFGKYFTKEEFSELHPASDGPGYHNEEHSMTVQKTAADFAAARGLSPADTKFIRQVALLHDIDPARVPGTPARVPETLKLLDQDWQGTKSLTGQSGASILKDRFGWSDNQFKMAKAMIQRTEFPFGATHPNPAYADASPVAKYAAMLQELSPGDRRFVLREGAYLSEYADKASAYATKEFPSAQETVQGLAHEINTAAGKTVTDPEKLNTAQFLSSLGSPKSFETDMALAKKFQVGNFKLLGRDQALKLLGPSYSKTFASNLAGFDAYQKAISDGKSAQAALDEGRQAAAGGNAEDYTTKGMGKGVGFYDSIIRTHKVPVSQLQQYKLTVRGGKIYDADGRLFDTTGITEDHGTAAGHALFVMDPSGDLYAFDPLKNAADNFHHSSFGFKQVSGAGEIEVRKGVVQVVTNDSGHYRPDAQLMKQVYARLERGGVDMSKVEKKIWVPAAKNSQNAQIAKALGMPPSSQVSKVHLGSRLKNATDKLTFSDGDTQVSVVLKSYTRVSSVKSKVSKLSNSFRHIYDGPAEQFQNEVAMNAAFRQAGLKTSDILLADPQKKSLVVRFIQGDLMSGIHAKALAGDQAALAKVARLGQALAKVHANHLVVGDLKPDNVMVVDGEMNFFDLDQASHDGPPGWDIAQFLYYPTRTVDRQSIATRLRGDSRQWDAVAKAFLSGYLEGGGSVKNVEDALNPAYLKAYGPLLNPKAVKQMQAEIKAAVTDANAKEIPARAPPKGKIKLAPDANSSDMPEKADAGANPFLNRLQKTYTEGRGRGDPHNPAYTLSNSIGLKDDKIQELPKTGQQGSEGTCSQHATAACLRGLGADITAEDVKMAVRADLLARNEIMADMTHEGQTYYYGNKIHPTKKPQDAAVEIQGIYQKELDQTGDGPLALERAKIRNNILKLKLEGLSNSHGINSFDEIGKAAASLGAKYRTLTNSGVADEAYMKWLSSKKPNDLDKFLNKSSGLRGAIDQELAQGRPVIAAIGTGKGATTHAVTIVQKGLDQDGRMMVKYYNSWADSTGKMDANGKLLGSIDAMPWDEFHPLEAAVIEPVHSHLPLSPAEKEALLEPGDLKKIARPSGAAKKQTSPHTIGAAPDNPALNGEAAAPKALPSPKAQPALEYKPIPSPEEASLTAAARSALVKKFDAAANQRAQLLLGKLGGNSLRFPNGSEGITDTKLPKEWSAVDGAGFSLDQSKQQTAARSRLKKLFSHIVPRKKNSAGAANSAAAAIENLYKNRGKVYLDCHSFYQLVWYGAILDTFGKGYFDGQFAKFIAGHWFDAPGFEEIKGRSAVYDAEESFDPIQEAAADLGIDPSQLPKDVLAELDSTAAESENAGVPFTHVSDPTEMERLFHDAPIGSHVVWKNQDPNAPAAWGYENAIKIGPDQFAAHPLGVVTMEQMRARAVGGQIFKFLPERVDVFDVTRFAAITGSR